MSLQTKNTKRNRGKNYRKWNKGNHLSVLENSKLLYLPKDSNFLSDTKGTTLDPGKKEEEKKIIWKDKINNYRQTANRKQKWQIVG